MEQRLFTASTYNDRDHIVHLAIELYHSDWGGNQLVEFNWISGTGETGELYSEATREALRCWHGFTVEITVDCLNRILDAVKVLRRVLRKPEPEDPTSIVARLRKAGYVQAVYDHRHHRLVTKAECLPADVLRWMDDYQTMHRPGVTEDCLARTAEEAKPLIAAELARRDDFAYLQEWVDAGQPVHTASFDAPPTWRDVDDMIAVAKPATTATEPASAA